MSARQTVWVAAVVGVVVALLAGPVAAVTDGAGTDGGLAAADDGTDGAGDNATGNVSFGAQLSSFVQANAAEANGSVESGMWRAAFDEPGRPDRAAMVDHRVASLERRLERLRGRLDALAAARDNGTLPRGAFVAQASHVTAEIDALEAAVNDTAAAADGADVNAPNLDRLRTQAHEMSGQQVARLARSMTVVRPPVTPPRRPPVVGGPHGPGQHGPFGDQSASNRTDSAGGDGANSTQTPTGGTQRDGGPGTGSQATTDGESPVTVPGNADAGTASNGTGTVAAGVTTAIDDATATSRLGGG
ncbi:MAG: hypothetical protein ABEJ31_08460 [Haloarculaceae archaeon]